MSPFKSEDVNDDSVSEGDERTKQAVRQANDSRRDQDR
jgi:hypothetical protein